MPEETPETNSDFNGKQWLAITGIVSSMIFGLIGPCGDTHSMSPEEAKIYSAGPIACGLFFCTYGFLV